MPAPKPSPQGLLQVLRDLNAGKKEQEDDMIAPAECVYVGDSPSDGQAAQAAGMHAVGVTWGSHSAETLEQSNAFSCLVRSVAELGQVLRPMLVAAPPAAKDG